MARPGTFTAAVVTVAEMNALGRVYTSGTRPTGVDLYEGLDIWETDTDRRMEYDGTGWVIMAEPAQSYTPTLTNGTLGNGTLSFSYHRSDGWCDVYGTFTLGTTSAVSGLLGFSLPVAATSTASAVEGTILIQDTGSDLFLGVGFLASTTVLSVYASNSAGTYALVTATSSTIPMTWATTDVVNVGIRYRMGTRYL